jgi:aspartate carbamoyltransferase
MPGPFAGRTIAVVNDLSLDEQVYLYDTTRRIKTAIQAGHDQFGRHVDEYRINDPEFGVYLFFLEPSTRTKESFRNAVKFHNLKVNDFHAESSSFTKQESIADTVKMLFGYSSRSMFIIRTKQEGVCRWLETVVGDYAEKMGMPPAPFVNAGDGKHEHPTQEFLDEFSFLEHRNWDRSHVHIALVGDLFHGRTVHSKADGLRIFREVHLDLVAPEELAMPPYYEERMLENGYHVRTFPSIEAYLKDGNPADIWYFTRLQLERMGDEVLEKADMLRDSVTFREEFIHRLPEGCRFYHPLPRHREHPVIPHFLDGTPLNGWDEQSMNGYFTRIAGVGMVGGLYGHDFTGEHRKPETYTDDFVEEVTVRQPKQRREYKVGIKPVDNGIVIDHIGRGDDVEKIWAHIDKIRRILQLNRTSSHGVFPSDRSTSHKGIISLPEVLSFDETQIKMLGAIAPGCTLNIIKDQEVLRKYRLHMPPRVYNFREISCKNESCVSNPALYEHVRPEFYRSEHATFVCRYCEKPHTFAEIWNDNR